MSVTAKIAAALLAVFEGYKTNAYLDPGGVPTIGIGHTKDVKLGMTCSLMQAAAWMEEDCAPLFALVADKPPIEAAALVSFGYNCGISNLKKALIDVTEINNPIHTTDRHGVVQGGLVKRRALEYCMASEPSASTL